MIVNLQATGWEIIYHRAHALLAAQIAGYWNFDSTSYRLYETIAAISHHDDLEKEWEGDQLTEAGAPLDFTLKRDKSLEKMRHHVEDSLYRGRWVALLTSMHLCFLNRGEQGQDSDLADFITEQHQRQTQWRRELDITEDQAVTAYGFMRWCDRLSLILCQRQVPTAGRRLEITTGPNGKNYHIYQADSGELCVDPWPFTPNTFTVNVDACCLAQLQFESSDALKSALKTAPRELIFWTLTQP